jgi:hypothetical protein
MTKRRVLAVVVAAAAAVAASVAAAPSAEVTLHIDQHRDAGNGILVWRFSGAISNPVAGEYIAILAKPCGRNYWTSTFGAHTEGGGVYRATTNSPPEYRNLTVWPPASYRASWNNSYSEPITFRIDAEVRVKKLRRLRYRATVALQPSIPADLRGKRAELQRFVEGQWRRVQIARFIHIDRASFGKTFTVTFSVPARSTLRVAVSEQVLAPCYNAATSKAWRT